MGLGPGLGLRILKVLVSEGVVSVSNGQVSVLVSVSDDEVSVSVSDYEAETPSLVPFTTEYIQLYSKCGSTFNKPHIQWEPALALVHCNVVPETLFFILKEYYDSFPLIMSDIKINLILITGFIC